MKFKKVLSKKKAKRLLLIASTAFVLLFTQETNAQVSTIADTSKMTYNQFSTMVGLYAYPAKNQSNQQQKKDEFESYKWAVQQTGYDPVHPTVVKADTVKSASKGTVIKKAAMGSAVGSIFGEVGRGAAVGAASGIMQKKAIDAKQQQEAQQNAQQKQQALVNNYKKAFSASMEGKGYTIK